MVSKSVSARFPMIRREFATSEEIGEVLNRSKSYVTARMVGKRSFTYRDKKLILAHLGEGPERMRDYFPEEGT